MVARANDPEGSRRRTRFPAYYTGRISQHTFAEALAGGTPRGEDAWHEFHPTGHLPATHALRPDAANLAQRIRMFLTRHSRFNWRSLDVFVRGETVIIHGRLNSALEKRLALQCCRHVAGVLRVVDEIEVETPATSED